LWVRSGFDLTGEHLKAGLFGQALDWKRMPRTNTLAYLDLVVSDGEKRFVTSTPGIKKSGDVVSVDSDEVLVTRLK
jgi:hypothetical protein